MILDYRNAKFESRKYMQYTLNDSVRHNDSTKRTRTSIEITLKPSLLGTW